MFESAFYSTNTAIIDDIIVLCKWQTIDLRCLFTAFHQKSPSTLLFCCCCFFISRQQTCIDFVMHLTWRSFQLQLWLICEVNLSLHPLNFMNMRKINVSVSDFYKMPFSFFNVDDTWNDQMSSSTIAWFCENKLNEDTWALNDCHSHYLHWITVWNERKNGILHMQKSLKSNLFPFCMFFSHMFQFWAVKIRSPHRPGRI